ncbi:MAG: DUF3179 domain-containing protein [Candidatus Paceibacterota bacterium]
MSKGILFTALLALVALSLFMLFRGEEFSLPRGEAVPFEEENGEVTQGIEAEPFLKKEDTLQTRSMKSERKIFTTDGVKHSIALDEILSGGPGKDGIPSIDSPKFLNNKEANEFLNDTDPGIGLEINGKSRFYPYRILVWHEIVNDTLAGEPVLVTYCPLCATGIVFKREVGGEIQEFGVSGKLWQSNLLMYNRLSAQALEDKESEESLWSQVLGEAVVGPQTGERLAIVSSDIVRWEDWKRIHPETEVLSPNTGVLRNYTHDPYGDYYTSDSVSFGAEFSDTRLHPKELVAGVELDGVFKAYHIKALPVGETKDTFAGREILIQKDEADRLSLSADGAPLPYIPGFWFSWLAVHPETELYK